MRVGRAFLALVVAGDVGDAVGGLEVDARGAAFVAEHGVVSAEGFEEGGDFAVGEAHAIAGLAAIDDEEEEVGIVLVEGHGGARLAVGGIDVLDGAVEEGIDAAPDDVVRGGGQGAVFGGKRGEGGAVLGIEGEIGAGVGGVFAQKDFALLDHVALPGSQAGARAGGGASFAIDGNGAVVIAGELGGEGFGVEIEAEFDFDGGIAQIDDGQVGLGEGRGGVDGDDVGGGIEERGLDRDGAEAGGEGFLGFGLVEEVSGAFSGQGSRGRNGDDWRCGRIGLHLCGNDHGRLLRQR